MQRRSHSYEPRAQASGIFAYERRVGWSGMAMILYFSIIYPFMTIGFAADHATRRCM